MRRGLGGIGGGKAATLWGIKVRGGGKGCRNTFANNRARARNRARCNLTVTRIGR